MAGPAPTSFSSVALELARIDAGRAFGRIHRIAYPEPLSFGKNTTRFSDPRRRVEKNRFGVLYLGASVKVCLLETLVRDGRDGLAGPLLMPESDLQDRLFSTVQVATSLNLIDLTGDGPIRMGIPSDVARSRDQTLARLWSVAIYEHPATVDGILYPSRLNGEFNLAIYDRAVTKLAAGVTGALELAPGLGPALDALNVALV